jgi:flagellar motor switch protein FliM
LLDQTAIDALFGVSGPAAGEVTGVQALLEAGSVRVDRLPILEVICDRVARSFATNMQQLTAKALEVRLAQVHSGRFGDLMNWFALPALFGVFRIPELDGYGVIVADTGLGTTIVEAMLGGELGAAISNFGGVREFTAIEVSLVRQTMQLALNELAQTFSSVSELTMTLERVETNPRLASVAAVAEFAFVSSFSIEVDEHGGRLTVLLPHGTLEPIRDKLAQPFLGESLGKNTIWKDQLQRQLWQVPVSLQAVIAQSELTIGEMRALQPGQQLVLDGSGRTIALQVEGVRSGLAELGQCNGRYAVRLLEAVRAS